MCVPHSVRTYIRTDGVKIHLKLSTTCLSLENQGTAYIRIMHALVWLNNCIMYMDCTQLYVVGTADSVLIREVPLIQSVL